MFLGCHTKCILTEPDLYQNLRGFESRVPALPSTFKLPQEYGTFFMLRQHFLWVTWPTKKKTFVTKAKKRREILIYYWYSSHQQICGYYWKCLPSFKINIVATKRAFFADWGSWWWIFGEGNREFKLETDQFSFTWGCNLVSSCNSSWWSSSLTL